MKTIKRTSTDNLPVIVPIIHELGYVAGNVKVISNELDDLMEHGTAEQWAEQRANLRSLFYEHAEALSFLRRMLKTADTLAERREIEEDRKASCFALGFGHALSLKFGEPFDHPCYTQSDIDWFHSKVRADVQFEKHLKSMPADVIALAKTQPLTDVIQ
ncbi:MAG: hypothetical protein BGO25_02665 [Acidobacteriales bacterium 59-55]|nr:hypothetical protein [Terriglobales bacterium]OJV42422.1 MAG: hypothetical protein BGO25_02665 [Acidobacteriales bacterium 59-55]